MSDSAVSNLTDSPLDRRLVALYEMIRRLNSATDPESLLEWILDMALEVVGASRGLIVLRGRRGEVGVRLARNLERRTLAEAEEFSKSVVAEAGSGRAVLAVDAESDPRFRHLAGASLYGVHSLMCVPLRSRGRIVGAVYVDGRRAGGVFDRADLRFLEAFADHAALALENARQLVRLERENEELREAAERRVTFGNVVGQSAPMRRVFDWIRKFADSALPVLIVGESGTGKELVARALHFQGTRRKSPFVSENCAAVPETLLQSELFGHVRGAFTGADRDRPGLFEQADRGTLFLDEVGDTSPAMQAQLLRVLEEGRVRRVGDSRSRPVDVRVLAATQRDLAELVAGGRFREDLMYRLQVLMVHLPPLRERAGDVPLLVRFFLDRIARERGLRACAVDPEVVEMFERASWPGNVRQLENALARLSLLAGDGPIRRELVERDAALAPLFGAETPAPAPLSLDRSERDRIREALAACGGNRTRAARMLDISRATLYRRLRELD